MNILALETATSFCSVALSVNGEQRQLDQAAPQKHAAMLLPMVEQLLADAGLSRKQLDAIAFGRGPGSFTGLRIAAAAAQGIALGLNLPVAPVSTLAAMAHQRFRAEGVQQCIACLDARMSEVYWGCYKTIATGGSVLVEQEHVGSPAELRQQIGDQGLQPDWEIAGDGARLLFANIEQTEQSKKPEQKTFTMKSCSELHPLALDVVLLALPLMQSGEVVAAADALPVYLRNRVALTEAERNNKKNRT